MKNRFSFLANSSLARIPVPDLDASTEGFKVDLQPSTETLVMEKLESTFRPYNCGGEDSPGMGMEREFKSLYIVKQPTVEKGMKSEVYLFGPSFCLGGIKTFNTLLELLALAKPEDEIKIYLQNALMQRSASYALLNALETTEAQTITHLNMSAQGVLDVAIWLAGKVRTTGKYSLIKLESMTGYGGGKVHDALNFIEQDIKENTQAFKFLIDKGFITQAEADKIITTKTQLAIFGPDLEARLARVNTPVKA